MKARIPLLILVLILAFSITVPAFADPGGNGNGKGMGDYASFWKIINGYNAFKPNPGQGEPDTPNWAPWGPTSGLLKGNCPDWCYNQ